MSSYEQAINDKKYKDQCEALGITPVVTNDTRTIADRVAEEIVEYISKHSTLKSWSILVSQFFTVSNIEVIVGKPDHIVWFQKNFDLVAISLIENHCLYASFNDNTGQYFKVRRLNIDKLSHTICNLREEE